MPKMSKYMIVTDPLDADYVLIVHEGVTKRVSFSTLKDIIFSPYHKNNLSAVTAPGASDDSGDGYSVGSLWINVAGSPKEAYQCMDATVGAAIWINTTLDISELGTGAVRNIEAGTAENDMLFGGPSPFFWITKTLAQAKAILGIGGTVPTPTAENDVIMGAGSPLDWVKKTIEELKTALGLGTAAYTNTTAYDAAGAATSAAAPKADKVPTSPTPVDYLAGLDVSGNLAVSTVAVVDAADAISKKHSNSLDHAQGTDQGLDTGGANAVTAAQVKSAVSAAHAPESDNQDLSGLMQKSANFSDVGNAVTAFGNIKQPASDVATGVVEMATVPESVTGTSLTLADTPAGGQAKAEDERIRQAENGSEQIQYPIPISGYMLKAASDGSPATATNTDSDVADAVTKKHAQNTDTGTAATSFKINTGGNEADLQTGGLTGDRDFTLPDIDTMLAGAVVMAQNSFEIIAY